MIRFVATGTVMFLIVLLTKSWAATQPRLEKITQLEQWPGVSQLIAYNQRIWFVNSQPYKDTNVADIYSYNPDTRVVRYERSLFSQDAGNPVVHNKLLYWPFEDPRRSAGAGEYAVTDGHRWRWHSMQNGSAMHVHAMNVCNNRLVAVTGSWTGQFLALDPDDIWRVYYDYPAGEASFSRLVNVGQFDGQCIVGASATGKQSTKLFSINNRQPVTASDWPISDRVDGMTAHQNSLFAFADTGATRTLLQFTGSTTRELQVPESHRPRAMHSDGQDLWVISQSPDGADKRGRLWRVNQDQSFKKVIDLDDTPIALTVDQANVYIGTYHRDGGALWQYSIDADQRAVADPTSRDSTSSLSQTSPAIDPKAVQTIVKDLRKIIQDPRNTQNYARGLRQGIGRHPALARPEFGQALTQLLNERVDDGAVTLFTQRPISRQDLTRWYLLTTLAINGHGKINPDWLVATGKLDDHASGKVFDPSIAAIVAAGWLNQNDPAVLAALMRRLNQDSDPIWVKSDIIGALTSLTQQTFGYDTVAWNRWWKSNR